MKKLTILLVTFMLGFMALNAQTSKNPKTDPEIKEYLVENGFEAFKFLPDGIYEYRKRVIGDFIETEGRYSVSGGLLHIKTCGEKRPCYWDDKQKCYEDLQIPGKYKLDLNKTNLHFKGALVNVSTGQIYWSEKWAPPYVKFDYEEVECIRYPWKNEGVENEYILILENLKLREMPSLSSKLVTVFGVEEEDAGYYYGSRSIALAGQVCTIRAKTVKKDTIDGITAPWYLIYAYGVDEEGLDVEPAFVFGGYVKEIKENERERTEKAYIGTLKESIRKLGGSTY
ncbi:MAG: hypothetical protein K5786_05605 [Treponema sp.]|nr:hypothetical protein [Treponema sp.]